MSTKKIGFWPAVSLVTGNMIGSGIFLLPASLSAFGIYSLGGWGISTAGAIILALVFARLSRLLPRAGGPYIYTREAFGRFPGFLIAWGYWICIWTGNAAIVIAFVSSLAPLFPQISESGTIASTCCLITVWFLTFINLSGVREASRFQLVTTLLKIIPIILMGSIGFLYFKKEIFFHSSSPAFEGSQVLAAATLTLWAFLGIESATIPAQHIKDPEKNIPRATLAGTLFSALLFIASCTAVIGIVPHSIMEKSTAPFSDAAGIIWGKAAAIAFALTAAISCLGALNGWILLQGQIPLAAAEDKIFPTVFLRKNKQGAPSAALILSSCLISVLILFNYSESLQKQFQLMILLSTLSTLVPYAFCSLAEVLIRKRRGEKMEKRKYARLIGLSFLALSFSITAIIGSGWNTIRSGCLLLAAGIPVYIWMVHSNKRDGSASSPQAKDGSTSSPQAQGRVSRGKS